MGLMSVIGAADFQISQANLSLKNSVEAQDTIVPTPCFKYLLIKRTKQRFSI